MKLKLGGHEGLETTMKRIKERYVWKFYTDVKGYIEKCESCQKNKI